MNGVKNHVKTTKNKSTEIIISPYNYNSTNKLPSIYESSKYYNTILS